MPILLYYLFNDSLCMFLINFQKSSKLCIIGLTLKEIYQKLEYTEPDFTELFIFHRFKLEM